MNNEIKDINIEVKDKDIKKEQKKQATKTIIRLFHKSGERYKIMLIQTDNDKLYISIIDNDKNKQNIALSLEECSAIRDVFDVFIKKSLAKRI
jgi:hypothetical protein